MADLSLKQVFYKVILGASLGLSLGALSACSVVSDEVNVFTPALNSKFSIPSDEIILVTPDVIEREQYQMLITQFTQALGKENLTHEQKAQILYQLGIIYDRLGLDVTARNMFLSSLIEVPDYAQAYNFLGIYLASAERFADAYDAYDSVLELDPDEKYAYFNRGIALYYGDRAKLAISDLEKFYSFDHNDPFRMAWLYIAERQAYGKDYALEHLAKRRAAVDKEVPWGLEVLDFLAGEISSHTLIQDLKEADIDKVERARRLCEAYFYMAKDAAFDGQYKRAYDLFHLCAATNVTGYLEYRYALMEIMRFERQELVAKSDQKAIEQQNLKDKLLKDQAKDVLKKFEALKK